MNIWGNVIATAFSLTASIIMLIVNRNIKKRDEQNEERQKTQDAEHELSQQERLLSMKMIAATLKLSEAVAIAARDGKTNGEMKAAMQDAETAKKAYYDFLDKQAYKNLA